MDFQQALARIVSVFLILAAITFTFFIGTFAEGIFFVFGANRAHNILHLVTGIIGLYAGFSSNTRYARLFNQSFGLLYLPLALLGTEFPDLITTLLNAHAGDTMIHILLGISLTYFGFRKT